LATSDCPHAEDLFGDVDAAGFPATTLPTFDQNVITEVDELA